MAHGLVLMATLVPVVLRVVWGLKLLGQRWKFQPKFCLGIPYELTKTVNISLCCGLEIIILSACTSFLREKLRCPYIPA